VNVHEDASWRYTWRVLITAVTPPTQLPTSSRGAEPSSESAASLTLHPLHGTVLPHHLYHISDTDLFKRQLKTKLFRRTYVASC